MSQIYRNAVIETFFRSHVVAGFYEYGIDRANETCTALHSGDLRAMHEVNCRLIQTREVHTGFEEVMFRAEQDVILALMVEKSPEVAAAKWEDAAATFRELGCLLDGILQKDDTARTGTERHVTLYSLERVRHLATFASTLAALAQEEWRNQPQRRSA